MKSALLIDGNFFLYRTVSIIETNPDYNQKVATKDDMAVLMRKVATDLCSQIRLFDGLYDMVVWTIDKKSWRKTYYPEMEYKANRVVDESINWENVSLVRDEFLNILKNNGVIVSTVEGAEGDDLIYYWSQHLKEKGKSSIILSGDKDLNQLVYFGDKSSCIQYSPITSKLYAEKGFSDWLYSVEDEEKIDIFNCTKINKTSEKMLLRDIISSKSLSVVDVDVFQFLFKKILIGDDGDNVKPAFHYQAENKKGKVINHGISDAKAEKIYNYYKECFPIYFDVFYKAPLDIARIVYNIMNCEGKASVEDIEKNIKMNAILMALNDKSIPEDVMNNIKDSVENSLKNTRCKLNEAKLQYMKTLLEGTEYVSENYVQVKSNVFKGEKIDEDMSFIKKKKKSLF